MRATDREIKVTEYDKVIAIMQNGVFKIMAPPEKTLLEGKLVYLDVFDPAKGLAITVVYRDKEKIPWAKKVVIQAFIHDKEYELIKERAGRIDYLSTAQGGIVTAHMVPAPRLRITEESFDLATLEAGGTGSRGSRVAERATAKITVAPSAV